MRKIYISLLSVLFFLFVSLFTNAQLTGVKNIPGDYTTIAAAVIDLNAQGVGTGGVTFNVAAGFTETLAGKIILTATGTASNPIIFQKSGSGANPKLTSYAGTVSTPSVIADGFWVLAGSDYVTIDGIDLQENAANTTTTTQMEFGYGLFKTSATDGCQNNTIKNCVITLDRLGSAAWTAPGHNGSTGIAVINALHTATGVVTVTAASGSNSFNKFYSNTIQNCNAGISFVGYAASSGTGPSPNPLTFLGDLSNDVGGNAAATGNTILNFGGGAAAAQPSSGIFANNQWSLNCSYNTINNNNGSGVNHVNVIRGIFMNTSSTGASADCNNNNITIHGGGTTSQLSWIESGFGASGVGNVINIKNNTLTGDYLTATTGLVHGILQTATAAIVNIWNNTINGFNYSAGGLTGSGVIYPIYNSGTAGQVNILGNTVKNIARVGTTGATTIGIYVSSGTNQTVKLNTVDNISIDGSGAASVLYGIQTTTGTIVVDSNIVSNLSCLKTSGTGALYGIYNISSPTNENFNYNKVFNLSHAGTGTTYGLYTNTATGTRSVSNNEIYSISSAGTTVAGMLMTNSSPNVFRNRIYNIQSTSSAAPIVSGIVISSLGTAGTALVYNNLIGDIKAPNAGSGTATAPNVRGINITSTTTNSFINIYYNTVFLNAVSSGTNFGSTALYVSTSTTATTSALTLRNNILINKSTPAGVGVASAYYRSSSSLSNYAVGSDNNLFYAGTNYVYADGTNSFNDILSYKAFVVAQGVDQASVSQDITFQSTSGASTDFLKYSTATANLAEGGAQNVTGITDDYAGTIRQGNTGYAGTGTNPDIGAWELEGAMPSCTGTPALSNTISSANPACPGQNVILSLDQSYVGVSYQWQSSTDNVTYTDIPSANSPSLSIVAATSTWYKCIITCNSNSTTSVPVQVIVSAPMSGPYTINGGSSTGGGNYMTFADAINDLLCRGVGGAVVFDVLGGTYNEQVMIPAITGASATNTITFNGNGATLSDNGLAVSAERAVIKLLGADHIIIDNFIINTGTATYGFGVQLLSDADSNIIRNCIINGNPSSTSSTNYAGIVLNSSATSITGTGDSQCDGNLIESNTIAGGYVGISLTANSSTAMIYNNKVVNNTIRDFYTYGIYLNGGDNTLIEGNDISRPVRSAVTTFYGINLQSVSTNTLVSKNKIHNPWDGALTNTSAAYGIRLISCDATLGNENIISNNWIYGFIGGAGTGVHNGILINSSDNAKYYYNSIVLDDAAAACNCPARGVYVQATDVTGIDFRNNTISIGRGGTGAKQAIYLEPTTYSSYIVDNNNYYINAPGTPVETAHVGSLGFATLADWQTASGVDMHSWSVDPMFVSPTDLHLTSSSPLDDKGVPIAGITTDIDGQTRDINTPDIGADELPLSSGIDMRASQLVSPVVANNCYGTETITIRIKNNSATTIDFAINPVTVTVNITGAATATYSAILNTGTLASGATQDVTMTTPSPTLNMSATGTYIFNATTSVAGDVNTGNNAMPVAERVKVALTAGAILATPDQYCITGGTPVLSVTGQDGYSSIQWQQSTTSGSGYTDIPGASVSPYTVGSAITQTMYYRLMLSCGASTQTSAEISVAVNNPQIVNTVGASRCGTGTVTLGATGSAGTTLNWYENANGGLPLGSGASFVTPSINTTTTYYVAAENIGSSVNKAVGDGASTSTTYPTPFYSLWSNTHNQYLVPASELLSAGITAGNITALAIDLTNEGTLPVLDLSVKIGNTTATDMSAFVPTTSFTTVYTSASLTPVLGTNTMTFSTPFYWDGTSNIIIEVCHGNPGSGATMSRTGVVDNTSYISTIHTHTSAGTAGTTQCTNLTTNLTTYSIRPKFTFTSQPICASPRMPVIATVNTPPAINASAGSSTICTGQSTLLNVTSPNAGYTYVWNPGNLTGASQTVSPTTNTTYTVTATDNSAGPNNGCVNVADVSITVNPLPGAVSITPASTTICTAANAQLLTATGGTSPKQLAFGTQASQNAASTTATGYPSPYTVYYGGQRMQMLITQTELTAAGFVAGTQLTDIQFPVVSLGANWGSTTTSCQSFQMSIGSTSLTSISAFQSGLTQVVAPANFTPTVGYSNVHTFSSPFVWDGTSNIIIETTFSNNITGQAGDLVAQYNSPTSFQSTIVYRADGVTPAAAASATSINFSYNARPDFKLNGSIIGDFVWSPLTGLYTDAAATIGYTGSPANTVYAKPALTTTYDATVTNSFGCGSSGSATITLVAPPSATISYTGSPYCNIPGTATVTQTGTVGGTYSSTTGLIIDATTGTVDVGASTPGTYTVTYTIAASNGCSQFQTTTSITITTAPSATIAYTGSPYCTGAGIATVTHTGTSGGTYSSAAGLSIDASTGDITLATSTPGTYTVTYTIGAGGGCPVYTATTSVTISNSPAATISYTGSPYCSNGTTATVTQSGSMGGVYSSTAGLTIDASTGTIDIATSTPGTYTVTYFIAAANGCSSFTTTTSVTINTAPAATISYGGSPYCSNAATATVTHTGTTGGTYSSTTGLSIDATTGAINIASSTAGNYIVTYTVAAANGCAVYTTTTNVTITASPTATINYAGSPYCSNGTTATVTRTGTPGGTYSSTTGLSIDATTGAINIATSTAGNYVVTYTVAAANGCAVYSTTANVTITAAPSATISYAGSPYCSSATVAAVTQTGTAGGTYSSTTGLSIDPVTGTINPSASTVGTYTVTYTVVANGCAVFSTTTNVTITILPSATISYVASPYCGNGANANVTRTGTPGGTYSSTTGLSINPSTGTINLAASTPGTYTVTYSVPSGSGCAAVNTTTNVTITTPPAATISYAGSPYCSNGTTVTVTQTGTLGGTYSSSTGLSINATTGAINLAASTAGTYVVTYTIAASGGCTAVSTTANVTISAAPSATISYAGSPYCGSSGIATATQTGNSGGTYSSTTGLSINANTGAINLATSTPGAYTVTYTLPAANGCAVFTTTASVSLTSPGTWTGLVSTDWNNAANWCGGIPSAATDAVIPSTAPNMPNLGNGSGSVKNIIINTGGSLTIGTGGVLDLYGNITGTGTFTATSGSINFRGSANQSAPAFTATNVTMNGAGGNSGVTLGGNTSITGTLTLTNGNITLGANNLSLGNSSNGTISSHIVTNGGGNVIVTNLAAAQTRVIPIGNNAASYNPVTLTANPGHATDNFTVRVQQGVYENGVSGATFTTHVADRMWIINEATAGGSNVNIMLQWAGSQELQSFTRSKNYIMQHNGTDWVAGTATAAGGTDPYTQTKAGVTSFGAFAVETERIPQPVTGIYPNPASDYIYVVTDLLSTGPVAFSVYDDKGTLVYRKQLELTVGLNQTRLDIGHLSAGVYLIKVTTRLNDKFLSQRFLKVN